LIVSIFACFGNLMFLGGEALDRLLIRKVSLIQRLPRESQRVRVLVGLDWGANLSAASCLVRL
jgi:hypothetical protein